MTIYLAPHLTQYHLLTGTASDGATLFEFLRITYQELYPTQQDYQHLQLTVDRYFSNETPLWFVTTANAEKICCLWVGIAIDQITGVRHPNIFLIYVDPDRRRQGIGQALMRHAHTWAKSQDYTQIGLQVFSTNQPALELYQQLGYKSRSISMMREL